MNHSVFYMDDYFRRIYQNRKAEVLAAISIALISILLYSFAPSRIHQKGYKVGSAAENFSLLNVDGQQLSLSEYAEGKEGLIVIFTCNHCPFSKRYEDRIIQLHKDMAEKGYPVLAINPNDPTKQPEDGFKQMQQRAKEKNYPFPYLQDKEQKVAQAFGAKRTPHVFLLNKENSQLKVRYIGAIDDNVNDASQVEKTYVRDAVQALVKKKKVQPAFTKAYGCTIKWK